MSRELWERRLLESVFVFYTTDLEHALDHLEVEPGKVSLEPLAQLRPFFELPDVTSEHYYKTMKEKHRLDIWAPKIFEQLKFPDTPYERFFGNVPISNEEIGAYIYYAQSLQKRLSDLSDEQVASSYRLLELEILKINKIRWAINGRARDRFAFFNELACDAKYDFWGRAAIWTLEECVSLSMGKQPDRVNTRTLRSKYGPLHSPFRNEFTNRFDLIKRAHTAGVLIDPIEPQKFITWARSMQWNLPSQLTERFGTQPVSPGSRLEVEPKGVSLKTLYRLLLGMAISRFEHRTDKNSNATATIENELQELESFDKSGSNTLGEIVVKNDTIRKALEAAADYLDASWSEPIRWAGYKRPRNKSEI